MGQRKDKSRNSEGPVTHFTVRSPVRLKLFSIHLYVGDISYMWLHVLKMLSNTVPVYCLVAHFYSNVPPTLQNNDIVYTWRLISRRELCQQEEGVFWPHVAVQEEVKGPATAWLKTPLLSPQSQIVLQAATGPGDWESGNGDERYRGSV